MADPRELVRLLVETCWSDGAGLDRMAELVAPGYVHHTPFGDWTFAQFRSGMEWVDATFAGRSYRVEHVLVEGDRAAAAIAWSATRTSDGSRVDGRGAYHCRLVDGLIAEDWDVFVPTA